MGLTRKLRVSGIALFVFGVSFGFVVLPHMLKSQLIKVLRKRSTLSGAKWDSEQNASTLKNGTVTREMWAKVPFPLEFNAYVFNVTNPMEVAKGEKPILRDVGPYVYDEWLEKVDLEDREYDDTLEYSRRRTWIFNPKKSKSLTGNEIVTVPHLFILSAVMATMRERPATIGITAKAIDSLFKKPDSIFIQTTVHDFLFGGLPIDCNVKDFAAKAVCIVLKNSRDLVRDGENSYMVSVFGHKNGTVDDNRIRVKRGSKDITQVGQVTEYKGEPEQTIWPKGSRCNLYNGTDGTIIRPYLFENEAIVSFSPDLCRTFSSSWDGTYTSVGGLHTNRYDIDLGDLSNEPEWNCFCDTEDTCPKKGLYDLFKCVGAPMVVSMPHFYKVHKSYLKQVVGLHPSRKAHRVVFDFEPITGSPVAARNGLQFNMFVYPIEKLRFMKTFATALLPIFWIQQKVTVPDEFLAKIRVLFTAMTIVRAIKWITILLGMTLCGAAAMLEYKERETGTKVKVLNRKPTESDSDKNPERRPLADKVPPWYTDSD